MTVKNNSNNDSIVETQCIASLPSDIPSTAELQIKIRELEKEIARLHSQIKEQRYGLTWLDVPEAFETESENKIPILEEVKGKAIDTHSDDETSPHIIIEGDNYHALTCLNYTHRGKIDVIYIDPPYNTGSDGFTYKDKRILKEFPDGSPVPTDHPLRHSYWLSFMSKRLELAKSLLSDRGVIFISIDDNEQANLKLLCDKVFGEENFVTTIHVEMSATQGMKVKAAQLGNIVKNAEYILVYSKNGRKDIARRILYDYRPEFDGHYSKYITNDNQLCNLKDVFLQRYPNIKWRNATDMYFEEPTFREFVSENVSNIFADDKITGFNIDDFEEGKVYKVKRDDKIFFIINNGNKLRQLLNLQSSFGQCDNFNNDYGLRKIRGDWWEEFYKDMGNVSKEGDVVYANGKKPIRLILQIIQMTSWENSTILDFFAGSGTTLHATMKLNAEDGGHRQCILVQQREGDNNICENVTYERNRRVMCGYTNAKGKQMEGLGGRLKYYRTAFVGKNASHNAIDADRVELSRKAGYLLALGENTLEEIAHTDTYQIFADNKEKASMYTAIFFTENYAKLPEFVAEIEKLQSLKETLNVLSIPKINVYIFCWGTPDIFESEFDDLRGIALKAIPQPILDVYKSINQ
ncbi:MAG: site-specific DNA-methyltransferase [Paludibacteraceae bacterium]|nr:site-specific DNA-methyltransferase [Paludibacteraceae bacterium]